MEDPDTRRAAGPERGETAAPGLDALRAVGGTDIVELAPSAMVLVDGEGAIRLVNAQAERLFGHPRAALLGQPVEMLVPERFRASHPAFRAEFSSDPRARPMGLGRDLFALRADGTEVPVELGLNPVRTAEGTFVLAAVIDITERKRAEERFRALFESAPSAMVMVDAAGRIVLANALTERLFGWTRTELTGQPVEVLVPERFRATHPADRAGFFGDLRPRPMGADRELYGCRRDGTEFPVEIGLNPLHTGEGDFVVAAVVDITERRRAQRALARKNEEVEAFVYIVSHDLRTPLVNLQGFARELDASCSDLRELVARPGLPEDVAREARRILDHDVAGALRYISASTQKFERLIHALLGLSRSGRQEYRPEVLDVRALVASTLDSLRQTVERARAEVVVGVLPGCWGDATAVGQVFSNLLTNALHYLDPARPGRIEVSGEPAGAMSHYRISDNGVGIPATARDRVFQVFQRFHPHLAPGEGMGLAIVHRVVDRHGGRVWVETEEGVGTTFHLTLPAAGARLEVHA